MILNPPRSEAEFSSKLRSISVHAADKLDDPELRKRWIPESVRRFYPLVGVLIFLEVAGQTGLWFYAVGPTLFRSHAAQAEMFRTLVISTEAQARECRAIIASGKTAWSASMRIPLDPVSAQAMLKTLEQQATSYRDQAANQERLNLGLPMVVPK